MFKVKESDKLQHEVHAAERNYIIQINDHLNLAVYTNLGERIIDPDFKLTETTVPSNLAKREINYLVDNQGMVKLPMVGILKLEGLTIRAAEELLQKEYATYYKDPYVVLTYANKRAIVLGAPGGQVIPLVNENIRLVEILALAQGINKDAKAHNIRVLRGDQIFVVDLTTIEGYKKGNIIIEPGDIIYVEPIRRPVLEAVRDYGPLLSVLTALSTLIVVINSSN